MSDISYIMARTSYIRWDENDVRFVLDQHAMLDFHSIILIPNQPVFVLSP
jgi:hypothetical protein